MTIPIASDMEIMATKAATSMAESMRMSPDKVDEVRLAVVEACINAFEHSDAPDRLVHLSFAVLGRTEPSHLRITVRDHGRGFDPARVETPLLEKKFTESRKRGWGLKIMEGLMDEVNISSGGSGTTVVMSKAL